MFFHSQWDTRFSLKLSFNLKITKTRTRFRVPLIFVLIAENFFRFARKNNYKSLINETKIIK